MRKQNYTTKSSAVRGAARRGLEEGQFEIKEFDGKFYIIEGAADEAVIDGIENTHREMAEEQVTEAPAPKKAKDVCIEPGCTAKQSKNSLGPELCDYHFEVAGQENTHSDDAHEGDFEDCPICKEALEGLNSLKANRDQSTVEGPCNLTWHIADSMPGARRKDVIAACVEQGIALNTARTQYQRWFREQRATEALRSKMAGQDHATRRAESGYAQ